MVSMPQNFLRFELGQHFGTGSIPSAEHAVLIPTENQIPSAIGSQGLKETCGTGESFHFAAIAGDEAELGITGAGGDLICRAEVADASNFLSQPSTLLRRSPVVQSQTLTTLSAPLLASRRPSARQVRPST